MGIRKPEVVQSNESPKKGRQTKQKVDTRQKTGSTRILWNPSVLPPSLNYTPIMSFPFRPPPRIAIPITPYFPPYSIGGYTGYTYPNRNYATNWNPVVTSMQTSPIYSVPMPRMPRMPSLPVTMIRNPMLTAPFAPYGTMMSSPIVADPMMSVVPYSSPPNMSICSPTCEYFISYDQQFSRSSTDSHNTSFTSDVSNTSRDSVVATRDRKPLDAGAYLCLPKELFPTARMMAVDPNPLIDLMCRETNIEVHTQWILDLEFGIPRVPVTRQIAIYDSQFNSVNCKNTPGAIHPGFENCSQDLKRSFLFYYDGIISAWFRGFMIMNSDASVANFQSWMQTPMQIFGMCWP